MKTLSVQYEEIMSKLEIVNAKLLDCREAEPYYLKVLDFIKNHPDGHKIFVKDFIYRIHQGLQPWEVIQFCMRELQWPEIKEAAIAEKSQAYDWRIISVMDDIIAVYEPEWSDADLYEYYSK